LRALPDKLLQQLLLFVIWRRSITLQASCKWSMCWVLLAAGIHAVAHVMWHFAQSKTIVHEGV